MKGLTSGRPVSPALGASTSRSLATLTVWKKLKPIRRNDETSRRQNSKVGQRSSSKQTRKPRKPADVLQLVREDAKRKGLDKLTMREINAEIEAYRREKDPLYGQ